MSGEPADQSPLLWFAIDQWLREPDLEVEDAYKWLYHATLGGEHAVKDDSGPRAWLDDEWHTLGEPLPDEPPVVDLRPDRTLIRVNLRPYKAGGGDKEALLAVFVASAREFHADRSDFVREWEALGRVLRGGPVASVDVAGWMALDREAMAHGYPAVEHSQAYLAKRQPAYRVMLRELWIAADLG